MSTNGFTHTAILAVRDALANSDELKAWGREHYSQRVGVHVGLRAGQQLPTTAYPIVVIVDVSRTYGADNRRNHDLRFGFGVGVMDDTISDTPADRMLVYNGMLLAEDLRELVCDVLERASLGRWTFSSEPQQLSFYPAFAVTFQAVIAYRKTKRRL